MDKIELPCPKGFKFLGYRRVKVGEWYSVVPEDDPKQWEIPVGSSGRYFVFEKKKPRRMVFEEDLAAITVFHGDYYTDEYTTIPELWLEKEYDIDDNHTTVWRLVNDD